MTVTVAQFRLDFPEFSDNAVYPNSMIQFWITYAPKLLNPNRWQDLMDLGTELLVAHAVSLAGKNLAVAAAGGTPGQSSGPLQQKTVGQVSASYDTLAGTEPGAGWYNLTSYGVQLYGMMQTVGMGGMQLGVGANPQPALGVWDNGGPPPWG